MSTVSLKISRKRIRMHRPSFSRVMLYIFLCLMVVVCALPLFAMVCRALMPLDELYLYPPRLIVQKPTLRNFSDLLTSLSSSTVPFTRYIFNSLFTTVATVLASILVCCLGAYGLVKHRPAGSNIIFGIVVAALSFSTHVTTIPNYLVVNKLGLVNTCWALIIPKIAVAYQLLSGQAVLRAAAGLHSGSGAHRRRTRAAHLLEDCHAAAQARMDDLGGVLLRQQLE